jgi:hypothetical protein
MSARGLMIMSAGVLTGLAEAERQQTIRRVEVFRLQLDEGGPLTRDASGAGKA